MASLLDQTQAQLEAAISMTVGDNDLVPISVSRKQIHLLLLGMTFIDSVIGSMAHFVAEVSDATEEEDGSIQS